MTRFDAARRGALMQDLLRRARGRARWTCCRSTRCATGSRLKHIVDRGMQDVPLERIVGTLGREREFNRAFLPREEALRDRWEEVEELAEGPAGFPPSSCTRSARPTSWWTGTTASRSRSSMGVATIEARVKEFLTPVPISPDASIEDVLLQRGLADFLEATGLVPERPDEFRVTEADGYERLLEHITVHRYYRGIETGARADVARGRGVVARHGLPADGGGHQAKRRHGGVSQRTETDLYLFIMDHLHHLRERYAPKPVEPTLAVRHFKFFYTEGPGLGERLRSWWRRLF